MIFNKETAAMLQERIGYSFRDQSLLKLALTHSSYANEHKGQHLHHNERIEFLGDAVLEIVSSEFLYRNYPDMPEGEMSKKRASLVCEPSLAASAREIFLGRHLLLGHGEEKNGGADRDSILSDAFESVIGAIYLDGGLAPAEKFIKTFVLNDIEHKVLRQDSKTILQEILQKDHKEPISYVLTDTQGPEHDRIFFMEVRLGDQTIGTGSGRSKQAAGQDAAYHAILALQKSTGGNLCS
jgi:ribonuclease-3